MDWMHQTAGLVQGKCGQGQENVADRNDAADSGPSTNILGIVDIVRKKLESCGQGQGDRWTADTVD